LGSVTKDDESPVGNVGENEQVVEKGIVALSQKKRSGNAKMKKKGKSWDPMHETPNTPHLRKKHQQRGLKKKKKAPGSPMKKKSHYGPRVGHRCLMEPERSKSVREKKYEGRKARQGRDDRRGGDIRKGR